MPDTLESLATRVSVLERMLLSPSLDPQMKAVFLNAIGVRYGTTAPTHTPDKETELWVISDGVDIRLWAWAANAWHYEILT